MFNHLERRAALHKVRGQYRPQSKWSVINFLYECLPSGSWPRCSEILIFMRRCRGYAHPPKRIKKKIFDSPPPSSLSGVFGDRTVRGYFSASDFLEIFGQVDKQNCCRVFLRNYFENFCWNWIFTLQLLPAARQGVSNLCRRYQKYAVDIRSFDQARKHALVN